MKQPRVKGTVIEALGAARFKVAIDNGPEVVCYLAGRVKLHRIRVDVQDRVEVELDPAGGKATNRIVWRF